MLCLQRTMLRHTGDRKGHGTGKHFETEEAEAPVGQETEQPESTLEESLPDGDGIIQLHRHWYSG